MSLNLFTRRGLSAVAAACLVSVALPAVPAMAQKTKTKPAAEQPAAEPEVVIDIPTVEAVGSSIDNETIKAILSGALVENADALATLKADSITVPEFTVTVTSDKDTGTLTFTNLVLEDVVDGVAASLVLEGSAFVADDGRADMGAISASNVNIRGILGMYGLVEGGESSELETLYADFLMEGGTLDAEDISCEFGPVSGAEVRGRPLKTSFVEIISLAQKMEDDPEMEDPALVGKFIAMYADMLTAFESSEFTFEGFACEGEEDGKPLSFSIGAVTMGGMTPGIYPSISVNDVSINLEGEGDFSVTNVTIKQSDLSPTIAALSSAPEVVTDEWFEANARALMPSIEGLSFSGLSMDLPDAEVEGERIVVDIDAFDLTLTNYINGIPSAVDTSATGIRAALPADSEDEMLQQFIAFGITDIDAGFRLAAAWDAATSAINIEEVSVSGVDLATIALAGKISNATEALFSLDEDEALGAAMSVAVKALNLDVTDAGLSDILLAVAAQGQGTDPAAMRPVFAGLAEGTILGMMSGAADAAKLGSAVNKFVSGAAKSLNISIEAKEDPGIGLMDFMAAQEDPTTLIGKVNISATAK